MISYSFFLTFGQKLFYFKHREFTSSEHSESRTPQVEEELTCIRETVLFKDNYVSVFFFSLRPPSHIAQLIHNDDFVVSFRGAAFVRQQKTRCFRVHFFFSLHLFFRKLKRNSFFMFIVLHRFFSRTSNFGDDSNWQLIGNSDV